MRIPALLSVGKPQGMAQNIDFNALKARTMGAGSDEEAVTVDTRGLISKVLARYSGKW